MSVANPYLFAGERFDNDLGLYYLRARYLDVETGRFWSLDDFEGGKGNPMTLHKYLYANGNPVSYTDPSGNLSLPSVAQTVGALVFLTTAGNLINAAGFLAARQRDEDGLPDAFIVSSSFHYLPFREGA